MQGVHSAFVKHPPSKPVLCGDASCPCIACLIRLPDSQGTILNRARLVSGRTSQWVRWRSTVVDPNLHRGIAVVVLRDPSVAPGFHQSVHGLIPAAALHSSI